MISGRYKFKPLYIALLLATLILSGCASLATQRLAGNLASAMLNQDDPATVLAGAPAYLLLLDGLIEDNPQDRPLLIAAARLYGSYATGLIKDPERGRRLSARSLTYARRALCGLNPQVCRVENQPYDIFTAATNPLPASQLDAYYTYATSWAGWIQVRSDDWNALADLPKVEFLLQQITQMEPNYDRGRAQLYLGVMRSQLPAALGGRPEKGRRHFEQSIAYSQGRDLIAKVEYARLYARLIFNRELHDRLLAEVLAANPQEPDLTLSNVLAQQQAKQLLEDDYFE